GFLMMASSSNEVHENNESSTPRSESGLGNVVGIKESSGSGVHTQNAPASADDVETIRSKMSRLKNFVTELPKTISLLSAQIEQLELQKQKIREREDLSLLHRVDAVQKYLVARRAMILAKVEENLLADRITQMHEYYQR